MQSIAVIITEELQNDALHIHSVGRLWIDDCAETWVECQCKNIL